MNTVLREEDLIHKNERKYFVIVTIVSILTYLSFILSGIGIVVIAAFMFFSLLAHGIMLGYIRTNGVRISDEQFPEVHNIVKDLSERMRLSAIPDVYVMQSGGVLNAFATRFFGRNMVILYSEVFELVAKDAKAELAFIIAHELAHIKRRHISKQMLILPAMWIPFVGEAYSRACEYTCDRYATHYIENPVAATNSLTVLAVGKKLYKNVNKQAYMKQVEEEKGFFVWLSEKLSTHPALPNRILEIELFTNGTSVISKKKNIGKKILVTIFAIMLVIFVLGMGSTYILQEVEKLNVLDSLFSVDSSPLIQAAINSDRAKVEQLVKQGEDVNEQDIDGYTALYWAVSDQNTEIVKILLENGADPNLGDYIEDFTPLRKAIVYGDIEIMKLLIENGADVNAQGFYGRTPLMEAVDYGLEDEKTAVELIQLLMDAGADPSLQDDDGWTALHFAVDNGLKQLSTTLRQNQ